MVFAWEYLRKAGTSLYISSVQVFLHGIYLCSAWEYLTSEIPYTGQGWEIPLLWYRLAWPLLLDKNLAQSSQCNNRFMYVCYYVNWIRKVILF